LGMGTAQVRVKTPNTASRTNTHLMA